MSSDLEYLPNYRADHLYKHPTTTGTWATLVAENEVVLGEIDVTNRTRLAITAFYVNDKADYGSFKIAKLLWRKTSGWIEDGCVIVNHFDLSRMRAFVSILTSLNLRDAVKARISLGDDVQFDALGALLASDRGLDLIRKLSDLPELHNDIYAVARKRRALQEFEGNLATNPTEAEWQSFFEENEWIFGHGLNYVFLSKVGDKLEATTTGATFDQSGKRADALMRTRAQVSQYVLVEIKRSDTELLQRTAHRPGCWAASHDLNDAVTQVQKTVFDFSRNRFRDPLQDISGYDLDGDVYAIMPRSYLVIGNLDQIANHTDKIACFELYRRHIRSPEILTFDELFERAKCIVENLSRKASDEIDDIPF
jgi:hypothetical protein